MTKIRRYSDFIILVIIWIVSISSMILVRINSYEIGIQNYIGYGLLSGISILKLLKVKRFKTILGISLIIGSINAAQFTSSTITMIFTWTPLGHNFSSFGIQPLSFSLLVILIILNFPEFKSLMTDLFSEDPSVSDERQKRFTEKHYQKLKNEEDAKLLAIIEKRKMYQVEYVEAAQLLIDERNSGTIVNANND